MLTRYQPKQSDYLQPDGWPEGSGEQIKDDDGYKDSSFPGCQFRLPTRDYSLAVNLKVTGRDHITPLGNLRCRVKIEFVGDGEPSTFSGGWLYHG